MTSHDWHRLNLCCLSCQGKVDITDFSCSADGELLFDLFCKPCDKKFTFVTTGAKLILKAISLDFETKEPEKPKPIKPPLKKDTSKDDNDFLRDMGIKGGIN